VLQVVAVLAAVFLLAAVVAAALRLWVQVLTVWLRGPQALQEVV
jgi:hypothetical protein